VVKRKPIRGLTLLELLLAVSVLAIVVAIAVPASSVGDDRVRLKSATWILASDIEYAQVMSISDPSKPVAVRFDPDANSYWLAYASDTSDPILRPDTGEPYVIMLGEGRAASVEGVVFEIANMNASTIRFESHGGLSDFTLTPSITFRMAKAEKPTVKLTVSPMTGSVSEEYEK
jgi:prepilin-type N-terminal cleavage/methylation domain-containing protein